MRRLALAAAAVAAAGVVVIGNADSRDVVWFALLVVVGWVISLIMVNPFLLLAQQARAIMNKAFDLGINFFDSADVYASGADESGTASIISIAGTTVVTNGDDARVVATENGARASRRKPTMTETTQAEIRHIYDQWHESVQRRDLEALMALYADEATLESPLIFAAIIFSRTDLAPAIAASRTGRLADSHRHSGAIDPRRLDIS